MHDVAFVVLYVEENQCVGIAPIDFGHHGVLQLNEFGVVVRRAAMMRKDRRANGHKTDDQRKDAWELRSHVTLFGHSLLHGYTTVPLDQATVAAHIHWHSVVTLPCWVT